MRTPRKFEFWISYYDALRLMEGLERDSQRSEDKDLWLALDAFITRHTPRKRRT